MRIGPGLPTANNRPLRPALAACDAIVTRLIATKRRRLVEEGGPQDGRRNLLTTVMLTHDAETGEAMSDAQLRDEVMAFMISGHDTTATAMIESQIIMGTLLAWFRAQFADLAPVTPKARVTLHPSRPAVLRLERASVT